MTKRSEDVWFAVGDEVRTYRGTLLTVNEWLTDEEAEEVARIAAAAPQMLKALEMAEMVVAAIYDDPKFSVILADHPRPVQSAIIEAIKKAKGEEEEDV